MLVYTSSYSSSHIPTSKVKGLHLSLSTSAASLGGNVGGSAGTTISSRFRGFLAATSCGVHVMRRSSAIRSCSHFSRVPSRVRLGRKTCALVTSGNSGLPSTFRGPCFRKDASFAIGTSVDAPVSIAYALKGTEVAISCARSFGRTCSSCAILLDSTFASNDLRVGGSRVHPTCVRMTGRKSRLNVTVHLGGVARSGRGACGVPAPLSVRHHRGVHLVFGASKRTLSNVNLRVVLSSRVAGIALGRKVPSFV